MRNFLNGQTVLFQGDSITDCDRDRGDSFAMGDGYPARVAAAFRALLPDSGTVFFNRGVSGDRVRDLLARYETDFFALKPDVVSILIGINDVWRRYDGGDPTSPAAFERDYRALLTRLKRDLPRARIMLIEPFVLHALPDRQAWHEDLDPKIQIIRKLAQEFADFYLPTDGLLARCVAEGMRPEELAADGVHPTPTGHGILAQAWLRHFRVFD
jgi:lysophospholipase L1-like esterase